MKTKLGMKLAAVGAAVLMTIAIAPASQAAPGSATWKQIDKVSSVSMSNVTRSYATSVDPRPRHVAISRVGTGKTLSLSITVPKGCVAIKWADVNYSGIKSSSIYWGMSTKSGNQATKFAKVSGTKQVWAKPGTKITFSANKAKPNKKAGTVTFTNLSLKCK
ncbi:hypothetical protein [Demequina silvatica]|uniref:hypothetical protein n=1 Tax=Demequina silvatica TaxID=1638988 RepID=UPI0007857A3F|nr:hypothetical protein [Demequina silvatica]